MQYKQFFMPFYLPLPPPNPPSAQRIAIPLPLPVLVFFLFLFLLLSIHVPSTLHATSQPVCLDFYIAVAGTACVCVCVVLYCLSLHMLCIITSPSSAIHSMFINQLIDTRAQLDSQCQQQMARGGGAWDSRKREKLCTAEDSARGVVVNISISKYINL